jgi:hypothetical protein
MQSDRGNIIVCHRYEIRVTLQPTTESNKKNFQEQCQDVWISGNTSGIQIYVLKVILKDTKFKYQLHIYLKVISLLNIHFT